jgi:hypothetical protein
VLQLRRALENRIPGADLDQRHIHRLHHVRIWQFTAEQALHDLQAGLAGQGAAWGHAGATTAGVRQRINALALAIPGLDRVCLTHRWLRDRPTVGRNYDDHHISC